MNTHRVTRKQVMQTIVELLRKINDGKVTVIRGAIVWESWDWPQPIAVSVQCSETFHSDRVPGMMDGAIKITYGLRVPEQSVGQIADDFIDGIDEQVMHVLMALAQIRVGTGPTSAPIAHRVEWQGAREWSDQQFQVQGAAHITVVSW